MRFLQIFLQHAEESSLTLFQLLLWLATASCYQADKSPHMDLILLSNCHKSCGPVQDPRFLWRRKLLFRVDPIRSRFPAAS